VSRDMGTRPTAPDRGRQRSRTQCRCTTVPDIPASPRDMPVAAGPVPARQSPRGADVPAPSRAGRSSRFQDHHARRLRADRGRGSCDGEHLDLPARCGAGTSAPRGLCRRPAPGGPLRMTNRETGRRRPGRPHFNWAGCGRLSGQQRYVQVHREHHYVLSTVGLLTRSSVSVVGAWCTQPSSPVYSSLRC
jgi:hypothetical protein